MISVTFASIKTKGTRVAETADEVTAGRLRTRPADAGAEDAAGANNASEITVLSMLGRSGRTAFAELLGVEEPRVHREVNPRSTRGRRSPPFY